MNISLLSYPLFIRHAELVPASHIYNNECVITKTLKQVQGDVRFYDAVRTFNLNLLQVYSFLGAGNLIPSENITVS